MTDARTEWRAYCEGELALLAPILAENGYELEDAQPHIAGERYLMQAVTTASGRKLILLGRRRDGVRAVIKATRERAGKRELLHEQTCRAVLKKIDFAAEVFHTPELLDEIESGGFLIVITRFIPQERAFIERPTPEQFHFALRAFKGQEGAHATTAKHRALIGDTFGIRDAATYLGNFEDFRERTMDGLPGEPAVHARLAEAKAALAEHRDTIEQYSGFLTHTDFVPHNFRIAGNTIILLDHSSLTFGNKYEGWARFMNFMTLYNPELERALVAYVRDNRTPEESVSLRMMRLYRLGEIIWYYVRTLAASTGDLRTLNTARIRFWSDVLAYVLKNAEVPASLVEGYRAERDRLRSADEKERQRGLH